MRTPSYYPRRNESLMGKPFKTNRIAVVGAGTGGIYLAKSLADALPKSQICLFNDTDIFDPKDQNTRRNGLVNLKNITEGKGHFDEDGQFITGEAYRNPSIKNVHLTENPEAYVPLYKLNQGEEQDDGKGLEKYPNLKKQYGIKVEFDTSKGNPFQAEKVYLKHDPEPFDLVINVTGHSTQGYRIDDFSGAQYFTMRVGNYAPALKNPDVFLPIQSDGVSSFLRVQISPTENATYFGGFLPEALVKKEPMNFKDLLKQSLSIIGAQQEISQSQLHFEKIQDDNISGSTWGMKPEPYTQKMTMGYSAVNGNVVDLSTSIASLDLSSGANLLLSFDNTNNFVEGLVEAKKRGDINDDIVETSLGAFSTSISTGHTKNPRYQCLVDGAIETVISKDYIDCAVKRLEEQDEENTHKPKQMIDNRTPVIENRLSVLYEVCRKLTGADYFTSTVRERGGFLMPLEPSKKQVSYKRLLHEHPDSPHINLSESIMDDFLVTMKQFEQEGKPFQECVDVIFNDMKKEYYINQQDLKGISLMSTISGLFNSFKK